MTRDNTNDETPYAVRCRYGCGLQFLTHDDYVAQMCRPDSLWRCPSCGDDASWDDDSQCMTMAEEA